MTSAPVQRLLDRLDGVKAQSDKQWMACCPAHPDRKPSLSIGVGDDGRALVSCKAGCSIDDVLAAMDPPMSMSDLFVNSNGSATKRTSQRKIVATYDYTDTLGVLLFQVVRYSDKSFRQRRPDENGGWIWNIKGVQRVPYRSPELNRAPAHAMVYLCEGEKDVDRLTAEGLVATCSSGGAGKFHLTDSTPLHDRHVVTIPDNDNPGFKHGQDAASLLHGKAASVRVLVLPGLPASGDVSDWLDAGNDPEDLDTLAAQAPEWEARSNVNTDNASAPTKALARTDTALATTEPYRDRRESMDALNAMSDTSRQLREIGNTLAEQVAEWLDRRGPETLDGIDYPIPYAASAVGVSRSHFHRLGQIGRIRRVLPGGQQRMALSDRAIRPLTRLLDTRPEAIPQAIESANEMVKAEAVREERTKPRPVQYKHTTAVVDEIIGPAPKRTPVRRKPSASADAIAADGLRCQISDLVDAAAVIDIPSDLRTLIRALGRHKWSLK